MAEGVWDEHVSSLSAVHGLMKKMVEWKGFERKGLGPSSKISFVDFLVGSAGVTTLAELCMCKRFCFSCITDSQGDVAVFAAQP